MQLQKGKQCKSTFITSNHNKKMKSNSEYVTPEKYLHQHHHIS